MAIMRDDPNMAKRLEQGRKEVEQTKDTLKENAAIFSEMYKEEIAEGTRKRQLLLSNGAREGKNESQVLQEFGKFLPSKETPIMNFLFFFMRDGAHPDWLGIQKKMFTDFGHDKETGTPTAKVVEHVAQAVTEDELEQIFGLLVHEEEKYSNVQEPAELDKYIYGNMSHGMFVKIKKLKALSRSGNENEAFLAYRLALKLCKKYSLEFDKIPCVVEQAQEEPPFHGGVWG